MTVGNFAEIAASASPERPAACLSGREVILIPMIRRLVARGRQEEGQGMVEYALILVLVSIVVILILSLLGGTLQNVFSDIVGSFH